MSMDSRAVNRLRKLYRAVLRHVRESNARMFNPPVTVLSCHQPCRGELLEPRLMLSGTSLLADLPADAVAPDAPVATIDSLLAGQVHSLVYTRSSQWEATVPGLEYDLSLSFEASLVDDITIILPWGETAVLSDYLPAGWAGEEFETEIELDQGWIDITVESLQTDPAPELDTYRYRFNYGIESEALDADAWWQAVDIIPTETIVEFPVGDTWSTLLDFAGVPLPDTTPQFVQPLPHAGVDSLRPPFEWTPWTSALDMGAVNLWLGAQSADDNHHGWWQADAGVSGWTPDTDLLDGQAYEYGLSFYNQAFDYPSGTQVNTTSTRQMKQSLVVDVTPGGAVDLRADAIQANAATAEAGGAIPGWIDMTNAGSDPVSFPWRIVLSSDATPDPSDRVIISEVMGLGAGEAMSGGGQVQIPADVGAGTYYMLLVLDPDDIIAEADETNNIAVSTSFTVTVAANFQPVAILDVFQCDRNDSLILTFDDLLANDVDYDGDPLTVVAVTEIGQTHGTLEVVDDQITYTPDVDYHGPARFAYTLRDPAGLESTAVANISVVWIPDGQVQSLIYERDIWHDAGVAAANYELSLDVVASLVNDITVLLPWGETMLLSDYLPADWAGEYFETSLGQGPLWLEITAEPLLINSDPRRDTYRYEFEYGLEPATVQFEAYLQATEVMPTDLLVEFAFGESWSTRLDFDGVPMPDVTPQVIQPLAFSAVDSLRPTIQWTPPAAGQGVGMVGVYMDAEDVDDEHGGWWPASAGVSDWTPDRDLLAGQAYDFGVDFYNQDFGSASGAFLDRKSIQNLAQFLTVVVTPGGTVDPRADGIGSNAASVEAGSTIPAWIELANAGSDPVSFPFRIVLSSDTTPDPSDRLIVESSSGLAAGGTMGGQGALHVPSDIAAGTYHLILVIDGDNLVAEADETNNVLASAPLTVTVPANFHPIAVADVFQCDRNDSLTLAFADLLANDVDYDGDAMTVVAVTEIGQTHGTLQVVGDQITYTPEVNYDGPARFAYTLRDAAGLESTGVVNIAVEDSGGYIYAVDTLGEGTSFDGKVSLREALTAANTNTDLADGLPGGSGVGVDRIVFDVAALQAEAGVGNPLILTLDNGPALMLADAIEILGPGDDVLTIDAVGTGRVIHVNDPAVEAVLAGLTLTGGVDANTGGGIRNTGTLTLSDVTVEGNSMTILNSGYGGGIYNTGTLTLTDSTVSGNTAMLAGGGIYNAGGTVTLTDSTVSGNSTTSTWARGAGIYNDEGTVTLTGSTVSGNTAAGTASAPGSGYSSGAGIYNHQGTVTLTGSAVSDNSATGNSALGGGIYSDEGTVTLTGSTVSGNTATGTGVAPNGGGSTGGGICNAGGLLTLTDSTVSDNRSTSAMGLTSKGGGITSTGRMALTDVIVSDNSAGLSGGGLNLESGVVSLLRVTVTENSAPVGGGINNAAVLTVTDSDITDNTAATSGGGIYSWGGGELAMEGVTVSGNTASENGGGVYNNSTLSMDRVEISDNRLSGGVSAYGGGLFNQGPAILRDVVIRDNSMTASFYSRGGGIYNGGAGGVMTVVNATVSGNAAFSGDGGGIENSGGTVRLTNVVVSSNLATGNSSPGGLWASGGGIMNLSFGVVTLDNSTVTGNRSTTINPRAGGIYNGSGCTLTMHNTIVALNVAPDDADIRGTWTGEANLVSVDPGLVRNPSIGPDGLWGTADDDPGDLRPSATGAAFNAGDNALLPPDALDLDDDTDLGEPLPLDLARLPRAFGGSVDIGAYERQDSAIVLTWDGTAPADWTSAHWNAGAATPAGGEAMVVDSGRVIVSSDVLEAAGSLDIAGGGAVDIIATGELAVTGDVNVGGGGVLSIDGGLTAPRVNVTGGSLTNSSLGCDPISVDGEVALNDGATLVVELLGMEMDTLTTTGAVTLGPNASLEVMVAGGGREFKAGTYTLIDAGGPLTGTFANVTVPTGYVSVNGNGLTYDYAAGEVRLTLDMDLNPGDGNLDGATDVSDRIIWNNNNFTEGTTWTTGDYNGDGATDVGDRIVWNNHNFTEARPPVIPQAAPAAGDFDQAMAADSYASLGETPALASTAGGRDDTADYAATTLVNLASPVSTDFSAPVAESNGAADAAATSPGTGDATTARRAELEVALDVDLGSIESE